VVSLAADIMGGFDTDVFACKKPVLLRVGSTDPRNEHYPIL
jgi:hypothetical protein